MEIILRMCLSWKTEIHRLWPPKTGEKPMDRAGMGITKLRNMGGDAEPDLDSLNFFWTKKTQRLIVVKSIWVADIRGKYAKNVPLLYLRISSTLAPSERRNAWKLVEKQAKYRKFQLSGWFSRYRVHKILRYKSCILSTKYPPGSAIHIIRGYPTLWVFLIFPFFSISPLFFNANRPSGRGGGRRVLGGRGGVGPTYYD